MAEVPAARFFGLLSFIPYPLGCISEKILYDTGSWINEQLCELPEPRYLHQLRSEGPEPLKGKLCMMSNKFN